MQKKVGSELASKFMDKIHSTESSLISNCEPDKTSSDPFYGGSLMMTVVGFKRREKKGSSGNGVDFAFGCIFTK